MNKQHVKLKHGINASHVEYVRLIITLQQLYGVIPSPDFVFVNLTKIESATCLETQMFFHLDVQSLVLETPSIYFK